ncbi:MAG: hypothetical protein GY811_27540 [Myxococcales bacterium]|nr:hypothetical protein [Myxococcales bacterium]
MRSITLLPALIALSCGGASPAPRSIAESLETGELSASKTSLSSNTTPPAAQSAKAEPKKDVPENNFHWTTKAILRDRPYAILGSANAPFYGVPARLRPVDIADVNADGVPDIVLRTEDGVEVYLGETVVGTSSGRIALPSETFRPTALSSEVIVSHSGTSWAQTSGEAPPKLALSKALGGAPYATVDNAKRAYHAAGGVVFVGDWSTRYWGAALQAEMSQNSSEPGSYVSVSGDGADARYATVPDFDGDGVDDIAVLAGHYEDWVGDDYWSGAIWFVATKAIRKKLAIAPHLTRFELPKEAAYSMPRIGGRTGAYGFAKRQTTAVYGTTLVAGAVTEQKNSADYYSLRMRFYVFDLKKGLPKWPAAVCEMFWERALSLQTHPANSKVEGVADFNGDGHLDLVLWEAAPEEAPGRAIVGFGPFCE